MELNLTPEGIILFIAGTIGLIGTILLIKTSRTNKITSAFYIGLGWGFVSLFFYLEAISYLLLDTLLMRISSICFFPATFFLIIGINYTIKESFLSINLIPVIGLGTLFCYLAFQPGVIEIIIEDGYPRIIWTGLFWVIGNIMIFLFSYFLFYWAVKTWINTPFLIKKEALIMLVGAILAAPVASIIYLFSPWLPLFILLGDLLATIGTLIMIIAIIKEPKLLYILPFTVYRILVKDREGYPLFDHDWSEYDISETLFTGFLNAVQTMSEEIMHIGGLLDINLQDGILIVHDSEYITVGLVASKSSKLLNDSLKNFSFDFEEMFERLLKKSCRDMSEYESAYLLIEKHFSNFPYRIIQRRKQALLLSGKYLKIPLELENKLNGIFTEEGEYEFMKSELSKSPIGLFSEFLEFYDELKEEINDIHHEEAKDIDLKINDE